MLTKKSSNINECPCLVDMNKRITYWTIKWEIIIRLTWNCVRWSILIVYIRFRHLFLKLMLRSLFIHEKGHLSKIFDCVSKQRLKIIEYTVIFGQGIHFWKQILKIITFWLIIHRLVHCWHPVNNLSNIIEKSSKLPHRQF